MADQLIEFDQSNPAHVRCLVAGNSFLATSLMGGAELDVVLGMCLSMAASLYLSAIREVSSVGDAPTHVRTAIPEMRAAMIAVLEKRIPELSAHKN